MTIYVFNDIHFDIGDEPHYPATRHVLPAFWKLLEQKKHDIDLAVLCGDLTVRGPADRTELQEFKERMDGTGIPYMALPGNHDLAPHRGFAARYPGMEDYEELPLELTNYGNVFGVQGLRSMISNDSVTIVGFGIRDEDPDNQLVWLETQLRCPGAKLVFCHYPLVPARDGGFCKSWEYKRVGTVIPRLKSLISDPDHGVKAYFCGHIHINSKRKLGNTTYQVVNGATGLSTVCYKRIDISDQTIEVRTMRIPGYERLYGKIMNPDRSIDRLHPDKESYHWGNEEERNFRINIPPDRG